jgi:FtsZ-interacting cell division protein ZipA
MSELQIALLVVGVLVIVGVIVYNRVQEARFRERAESAFATPAGDALLEGGVARERIEPQFQDDDQSEPAGVPHRQEPWAIAPSGEASERAPSAAASKGRVAEPARAPAAPPRAAEPQPVAAEPAMAAEARVASESGEGAESGATAALARPAEPEAAPSAPEPAPAPAPEPAPRALQPDPALASITYTIEARSGEPFLPSVLDQLVRALGPLAGRVQLLGRLKDSDPWEAIDVRAPRPVRELRAALQLVDRRGAVTQQDMVIFQSAVARCAASSGASADIPDAAPFLARTRALDGLCAEVDVVVGINLVAQPGRPFAGTRLRGLAEAAGFRLERGAFVYPDGQGGARFTLEQQNGAPMTPDTLRSLQASAVTLLLDVPRQPDGVAAFDQMVAVGRQLAQALGASLVDDNQSPVSESGLEQIRNQLRAIYANMESHGIAPGSPAALRLFS